MTTVAIACNEMSLYRFLAGEVKVKETESGAITSAKKTRFISIISRRVPISLKRICSSTSSPVAGFYFYTTMPLEASLFYGGHAASPSTSRGAAVRTKRPLTDMSGSTSPAAVMQVGSSAASTSRTMHTPSPSRTSRIPPPPASPTPSPRRAAAAAARRRPAAASKVSPSKFKLHFQGRVYRPFAATSPPSARKLYSPSQGLLGQPDELVDDADAVIDCPCQHNHDDSSLMIQCEECDIWLHARCIGYEYEEECPQEYFCRKCAPSSSSSTAARTGGKAAEGHLGKGKTTSELFEDRHQVTTNSFPSPPSSVAALSESEEDGGLEVEVPAPLDASPLNRTPTRTPTKRTASSPSQYSVSRNLLSDFANASPIIKASPSHPLLTPSKRPKVESATLPNFVEGDGGTTPQKRSHDAQSQDMPLEASTVPLPDHYTALLNLHAAVERALLLHLATEGAKACSAAVVSSDGPSSSSTTGNDNLHVDLPNLATFTGIRAVVERGSGKRFGPTELAQLIWLWEGGLSGPQATEDIFTSPTSSPGQSHKRKDGRRGGLSMSVSPARELDRNNGKRVYTWGIGIHLELKQNVQLPALELVGSSPSARTNGAETPQAPNLKRVGMSVLPLWSSKAEYRREEMRRRLGECVIKAHDDFSAGQSNLAAHPASKKKRLSGSVEQDLQLPPTPPPSNRKKGVSTASGMFARGFILDALPPIPAASLPPLGPSSITSLSAPNLVKNQGIANADAADIAREDRAAIAPSTRDTANRPLKQTAEERRHFLLDGQKEQVKKAPAEQRAMSLLDRVSGQNVWLASVERRLTCMSSRSKPKKLHSKQSRTLRHQALPLTVFSVGDEARRPINRVRPD